MLVQLPVHSPLIIPMQSHSVSIVFSLTLLVVLRDVDLNLR